MQLNSEYKIENWSKNHHQETLYNAKEFLQKIQTEGISKHLSYLISTLENVNRLIDDMQQMINEGAILNSSQEPDEKEALKTAEHQVVLDLLYNVQSQAIQKAAYPFIQMRPHFQSL